MIVTYNKEQVGDVLMLTLKNSGDAKLAVERKANQYLRSRLVFNSLEP